MHLAASPHLLFPDDRNVVFSHARDYTRVAADAGIEIDRHSPTVTSGLPAGIERQLGDLVLLFFLAPEQRLIFQEPGVGSRMNQIAPGHGVMRLCGGHVVPISSLDQFQAAVKIRTICCSQCVSVVARASSNSAGPSPAVSEKNSH